jgi:hypothetical protein
METLHVRADHNTIKALMDVINEMSRGGKEIEILDNTLYDQEQKMVLKSLIEEQQGETFEHDEIWSDLLK